MSNTTRKKKLFNLSMGAIFVVSLLIISVPTIQAEERVHTISVGTILDHNHHLLEGTTLGSILKVSPDREVRILYRQAEVFLQEAKKAHEFGDNIKARTLASKSINIIYDADRTHYKLETSD